MLMRELKAQKHAEYRRELQDQERTRGMGL